MTEDYEKIRKSYNFSFQEMFYYCQEKIKPDECRKMTLSVLKAVLEKN